MIKIVSFVVAASAALLVLGCGGPSEAEADQQSKATQETLEAIAQDPASGAASPDAATSTDEYGP